MQNKGKSGTSVEMREGWQVEMYATDQCTFPQIEKLAQLTRLALTGRSLRIRTSRKPCSSAFYAPQ